MANVKITELDADTSPTSDDLVVTVNDAGGTPTNKKVTAANLLTKAHGLTDGNLKIASGVMTTSADIGAQTGNISEVISSTVYASGHVELGGSSVNDSVTLDASSVATGKFTQTMQAEDGEIALTSDIPTTLDDLAAGDTNVHFTTTEQSKLSGIEAGADVTDATNVAAAGALMDSEVTDLSGIKTLSVPDNLTITVGTSQPGSPATGDLWIDTSG